jgi:hypothetical protein
MGKPRITVTLAAGGDDQPPQVRLYLNPEGRDLLVRELNRLDEQWDHLHLQNTKWTVELPLQMIAYEPAMEDVADDVQIMLRPDKWDADHFPHVLEGDGAGD